MRGKLTEKPTRKRAFLASSTALKFCILVFATEVLPSFSSSSSTSRTSGTFSSTNPALYPDGKWKKLFREYPNRNKEVRDNNFNKKWYSFLASTRMKLIKKKFKIWKRSSRILF